jgi:hypothetical protein
MARNYTIAQLITRAKERADMESTTFVDDTEWQGYINNGYAELVDLLIDARIHQFETTATITTAAGTASYAVPADHYRTLAVDYLLNSTTYIEVPQLMFEERNNYQASVGGGAYGWRLVGENVVLYPTPQSVQTYRHTYIPAPADISAVSTATNVNGIAGWEEYIVIYAALQARLKEEDHESAGELRERLQAMESRIEAMGHHRGAPLRIADVNDSPEWFGMPYWGWRP